MSRRCDRTTKALCSLCHGPSFIVGKGYERRYPTDLPQKTSIKIAKTFILAELLSGSLFT